jgi:hypothetical protein
MVEPNPPQQTEPKAGDNQPPSAQGVASVAQAPTAAPGDAAAPASQLTPEEQMALFAQDLKENDWGHQPC